MLSSMLGKVPLVMALCLSALPHTLALRTASACQGRRQKQPTFCVNATIENDVMTYQLTNLVEPEDQIGWMAIGHGTTMLNSDMYILWKNDDGSTTVSQRRAVWYSEPLVLKAPKRLADPVEPKLTAWHPEKSTTYAFQIPVNKTRLAITSKEDLIYAYSPVRPSDESPHASMARHKEAGYITLEFSEEQKEGGHMPPASSPGKTPSSHEDDKATDDYSKSGKHTTTVLLHAFFLSFGFLLLLPTGVITARWARTFTPVWFKVHWIINFPLALPCILLGWIAGPIAVNQHGSRHFNDQHKIWGTIIVSVYLVQVLLGRHIHQKKLEQIPLTRVHPPMNIGHAVLGCLLLVFAFLQVRSGLEKLSYAPGFEDSANWGIKLWNFWVVAVPFVYIVGLYLIPKQFAQEREMVKNQNAEGYAALPDNEGARLLAAAEERDMEERMNSKPR